MVKNKVVFSLLTAMALCCICMSHVSGAGLTVLSGSRVNLNGATLNLEKDINNAGTVQCNNGKLNLGGDWLNSGVFSSGMGLITFNSSTQGQTVTTGGSTFATVTVTNSHTSGVTFDDAMTCVTLNAATGVKKLSFGSTGVHNVTAIFNVNGSNNNLIKLTPTIAGSDWNLNAPTTTINFVSVDHSQLASSKFITALNSIDNGNNSSNWLFSSGGALNTPEPTATPVATSTPITATPTPSPTPTVSMSPTPMPTMPIATPTPSVTETPTSTPSPTPSVSPTPATDLVEPVSKFSADPLGGFAPLTVQFNDLSEGNPTSWAWMFGDGGFSAEQNPIHVYKTAGNFNVSLQVCNSKGCDFDEQLNLIDIISTPPCSAAFNADKTFGFAPLEVKFTDLSSGAPASWAWDFGDSDVSAAQNPAHTYKFEGIFSVSLTISAKCGTDVLSQANLVTVKAAPKPTAEFNANPTGGLAPLEVQFNNISTGEPSSFVWKFGDGGSSSDENPKYTYKTPGIFTVSLMASNQSGADIETKTNLINIQGGEPPRAEFKASPLTGFAPLMVQFDDLSAGNITSWGWKQGDGTTSNLKEHVHSYAAPGFYNVELIVSGEDGSGLENKINLVTVLEGSGPTANFTAEPLKGNAPFTARFFDLSSGDISDRIWDFGDGDISKGDNPEHLYKTSGTFDVKLIVTGKDGQTSVAEKKEFITVTEGADPTAGFAVDKKNLDDNMAPIKTAPSVMGITAEKGANELTVKFSELTSAPGDEIVAREWDFGDGSPKSAEENPEHTYIGADDETFAVSLTAQTARGVDTVTKPSFISISGGLLTGFIKGIVTDKAGGAPIPATAILVKQESLTIADVATSDNGAFFMQLPLGEYNVVAAKVGFADVLKKAIVKDSETTTLNFEMRRGKSSDGNGELFLNVEPTKAKKTIKKSKAIVTAIDSLGNPVAGAQIKASVKGRFVKVAPRNAKTNADGTAEFEFKFGLFSKNGEITFSSQGAIATITQE